MCVPLSYTNESRIVHLQGPSTNLHAGGGSNQFILNLRKWVLQSVRLFQGQAGDTGDWVAVEVLFWLNWKAHAEHFSFLGSKFNRVDFLSWGAKPTIFKRFYPIPSSCIIM